jgi:hypothetical protein
MALMMRFHLSARRVALGAIAVVATAALGTAAGLSIAAAAPSYQAAVAVSTDASRSAASHAGHAGRGLFRLLMRTTVKDTGLARTTVLADLRAGQTFDQIAGSKKSAVESDVLSTLQTRLSKAVGAHRITQAQADTRLAKAKTALEKLMATNLSGRLGHAPASSALNAAFADAGGQAF